MKNLYPLFIVDDLSAAKAYYCAHFGFVAVFEANWYLHLREPDSSMEVAFIVSDHATVPESHRGQRAAGALVSIELEDVRAFAALATAENLEIAYPLTDEVWGQRHLMLVDPNGLLIDVIEPIEPDSEWLAAQTKIEAR